jgi:hypothetical protein
LALDDPVVAYLKQEMQEMKTIMRALLQGGVETGKKQTPKKARTPKDKGGIPKEEKARCALLKGKEVIEDNAFTLEDDDDEDFVSDDEPGPREALKAKLERLQKKRSNQLRNWKDGKARNCDPNKVWDDIQDATAQDLPEAFQKMEK